MQSNIYEGMTMDELKAALKSLQNRNTKGELSMTTGAGLQQVRSWQGAGRVRMEIMSVRYAMYRLDPVTYRDPYAERVRRTRSSYTRS